jgi:uncharacterized protein (TIGR00369 family)
MDPNIEQRVQADFTRQPVLAAIGATLAEVQPGEVAIELPIRPDLTQQHGFVHAGIITLIADAACGFAALTRMPPTAEVLSVEFKVNLLSPAIGEKLIARGRVVKPGKTLLVCTAEVHAQNGGADKLVALMQATMIAREDTGLVG